MSWYLPNCSKVLGDFSSERRHHQVVEPRTGSPVVEAEVLVAGILERVRIVVNEERLAVDPPADLVAAALDLPAVVLVRRDLAIGARGNVVAVLVPPREDRLLVSPSS